MKWAGPMISSGVYFYQKRNYGLSLADLEDLKRVRNVGVVLGNAEHRLRFPRLHQPQY
ncbi:MULTISPECIES: hypothetical protein [Shewanella]|uniref:hypothetical protein n=1 Tax=Shewanella TaxID=22 RepID=UPI001D86594E|nr:MULTISPECIES: hypothetical protein [Shewanella]NCQ46312.1 hypothetical protein [Shewanella frigidimarina]NCO72812.1 hypothetical protein [Shewanella vesiculosa]NCP37924.1 hypothetical protein [Shewanella vesiculosa]NCP70236.1 hypothetical protein [Shewanella vesiculosa]NCP75619.1 hypothetical protein [Shewanella vesiculosa]